MGVAGYRRCQFFFVAETKVLWLEGPLLRSKFEITRFPIQLYLRVAEIRKLDLRIENGAVVAYRARVNLSFKYGFDG